MLRDWGLGFGFRISGLGFGGFECRAGVLGFSLNPKPGPRV